jgi:hypothetical protein
MSTRSVLAEKHSMYELIPVIQNWLMESEYIVTVIANRIDVQGIGATARLFFEDYPIGCLIKVVSSDQFFTNLKAFLSDQRLLTSRISCSYCGRKYETSQSSCPYCGASGENNRNR